MIIRSSKRSKPEVEFLQAELEASTMELANLNWRLYATVYFDVHPGQVVSFAYHRCFTRLLPAIGTSDAPVEFPFSCSSKTYSTQIAATSSEITFMGSGRVTFGYNQTQQGPDLKIPTAEFRSLEQLSSPVFHDAIRSLQIRVLELSDLGTIRGDRATMPTTVLRLQKDE